MSSLYIYIKSPRNDEYSFWLDKDAWDVPLNLYQENAPKLFAHFGMDIERSPEGALVVAQWHLADSNEVFKYGNKLDNSNRFHILMVSSLSLPSSWLFQLRFFLMSPTDSGFSGDIFWEVEIEARGKDGLMEYYLSDNGAPLTKVTKPSLLANICQIIWPAVPKDMTDYLGIRPYNPSLGPDALQRRSEGATVGWM